MFPKHPEAEKEKEDDLRAQRMRSPGGGGGGSLIYTTKEASNLLRAEFSEDTISC